PSAASTSTTTTASEPDPDRPTVSTHPPPATGGGAEAHALWAKPDTHRRDSEMSIEHGGAGCAASVTLAEEQVRRTRMSSSTRPGLYPEEAMTMDLFAGIPVTDLPRAITWFEQLLGTVESFDPNDVERVWTVIEHGHIYVIVSPDHAGHGLVTLFVEELDDFMAAAQKRGVTPVSQETYDNGVRKFVFNDPDGNEVGVGGK
ncbi:VOC family protein, partial [Gordonia bronchialis]